MFPLSVSSSDPVHLSVHLQDGSAQYLRGNEPYVRPCGWNRVALRVSKKYDDSDVWLGTGKDSWPVSYNGHNMDGSLGIILAHKGGPSDEPSFLDAAAASLVVERKRGRGVYSTPDIKMAEKYCKRFKSKVDGKTYKVVLQNRINPAKRVNCQRDHFWVVYIPEDRNDVQTKAIVQESIRPYGLLLKQVWGGVRSSDRQRIDRVDLKVYWSSTTDLPAGSGGELSLHFLLHWPTEPEPDNFCRPETFSCLILTSVDFGSCLSLTLTSFTIDCVTTGG